jgi:phosphatidylglycerol---prolipoprotein diacylglyceryl transferase
MPQHSILPSGLGYALAMSAGILFGAYRWHKRAAGDTRLLFVFIGALVSAFVGAKIGYVIAEGALDWAQPDRWIRLATGKTVLGGLLGGYLGVEATKRLLGYARPTSDRFAFILPIGIMLGRVGCLLHGCCLGRAGYAGR